MRRERTTGRRGASVTASLDHRRDRARPYSRVHARSPASTAGTDRSDQNERLQRQVNNLARDYAGLAEALRER